MVGPSITEIRIKLNSALCVCSFLFAFHKFVFCIRSIVYIARITRDIVQPTIKASVFEFCFMQKTILYLGYIKDNIWHLHSLSTDRFFKV